MWLKWLNDYQTIHSIFLNLEVELNQELLKLELWSIRRDIKCANILVDSNGQVKLADFGLAKVVQSCHFCPCTLKKAFLDLFPFVIMCFYLAEYADIWMKGMMPGWNVLIVKNVVPPLGIMSFVQTMAFNFWLNGCCKTFFLKEFLCVCDGFDVMRENYINIFVPEF